MTDELTVKVECGYKTVAQTSDLALCAEVLTKVVAANQAAEQAKTPEQRLIEELEEQRSKAETEAWSARHDRDKLRKELDELKARVGALSDKAE